jgi:putative heme-binding domain-containing protein
VIEAVGKLEFRDAVPALIDAASRDETRAEAIRALAMMPDPRALSAYVAGLIDRNPELRAAAARAIGSIRDDAARGFQSLADRKELPPAAVSELVKIYASPQPILNWHVLGPAERDAVEPHDSNGVVDLSKQAVGIGGREIAWRRARGERAQGRVDLNRLFQGGDRKAFAYTEIESAEPRQTQLMVGSDDTLRVWVNGKMVYDFQDARGYSPDAARLSVDLAAGVNRVLVACGNEGGGWEFSVALSPRPEHAFLKSPGADAFDPESFRQFARDHAGDARRGRELFFDLKGLACVKCHRSEGQGGVVGPDLSNIGAQYSRDELAHSVLYPSAKIFSGYEPIVVATADGRVVTGILKSETAEAIEIVDAEAQTIRIVVEQIEDRRRGDVSLMPSGLAEGLSKDDFSSLIAYLTSLRSAPAGSGEQSAPKR